MRSGRRSRPGGSGRGRRRRSRRRSARASCSTRARPSLSRWASGSSSSSTSGCCSRHAASAMSFRWPPERLRVGSDSSAAERPSSSRAARARPVGARPAGGFESLERVLLPGEHARHPVEIGDHLGAAELRAELGQLVLELDEVGARVEHGLRAACGRHRPGAGRDRRRGRRAGGRPRRRRAPRGPARIFSSVDLPPPFGPTTPIRAFGSTARSAPSRMRREPKDFVIARPASSVIADGASVDTVPWPESTGATTARSPARRAPAGSRSRLVRMRPIERA